MSREVDQRVVEMQFNNANFEKNTRQSIATIDRLMEKLQFKGAEKGFEKLDAAAEKVDFDTMSRALDALESKFSAVNIMAVTALVNITNKAVDAGTKLAKSLSIDQVTAGWSKYAQKTASVQTIMNATGKSITKVNSYLDKLMWYSDETSYGFTDMTASLGQLTAAGGDIDKLIPMIMGIANATAYAGKGASEFSRVIYNLNQSYSQGYLSLMDWKSVELAGVATAELKKQIIDTGVELGKIKEGTVTIGTFGTSLSKKWADKEVMETAFGKLAEFTQAVKDAMEANPKQYPTAAKAIEDLADKYDAVTVRAFKAAQEAKSFSDAIDATKDAVSTGWLETFEIVFGDYEEAKGFWTDLADELYEVFAAGKDSRNSLLHDAFDNGWTQMLRSGLGDVSDVLETGLQAGLNGTGIISDDDIVRAGSFQEALGDALRTGKVSADNLEQAIRGAEEAYTQLLNKSDAEIEKLGYTRKEAEKFQRTVADFLNRVDKGELSIADFAEKMSQPSGRQHLFQGVLNTLEAIDSLIEPLREAFFDVLAPSAESFYNSLSSFDRFTEKLVLSEETTEDLRRTFSGCFAVLKMGGKIVIGIGRAIGTIVESFAPAGKSALKLTAGIGDYLVALEKSSTFTTAFEKVLGTLHRAFAEISDAIQIAIRWIMELGTSTSKIFDPFAALGNAIVSLLNFITPKLKALAAEMSAIFKRIGSSVFESAGSLNDNALWGFVNAGLITGIIAGIKGFVAGFKEIGSTVKDTVDSVAELLDKLGEAITAWKTNKNAQTLKTVAGSIAILAGALVILSMVEPTRLAASIGTMTSLFIELLGAVALLTEFTKDCKNFGKGTSSMILMSASVLILAESLKKIGTVDGEKLLSSVVVLGAVIAELVAAQVMLSKFAAGGAKNAMSIMLLAVSVKVLSAAITPFAELEWEGIGKGLVAVGGLLVELGLFAAASRFSGLSLGTATSVLILSAALLILQKSVSAFGSMDVESLKKGIISMGVVLAEVAVFNVASSAATHTLSTASSIAILAGSMLVLSRAIASMGGMTPTQLAFGLGALAIGLTEMGVALTVVGNSIGSAASFMIMSVALSTLVVPLKALGNMELPEIGRSLLVLGGSMAIMAVAIGALSYFGPIVIAVSVALSMLAGSLAALLLASAASDFIDNLSAGLSCLQTIRLEAFVNTLKTMGMALGYFVAGLVVGLGAAIGSIATAIGEIIVALCHALTAALPAIGQTLIALINALCDVLLACLPKIGATLTLLIYTLCDVLVACTPKILETIDIVLGSIFSYIGSKFGQLGRWLSGKIQTAFESEHGSDVANESGAYVAEGYTSGIESGTGDAADASKDLAEAQDNAFNSYWDINSPSRRAMESAGYIVSGYIEGIQNGETSATQTMTSLAQSMDGAFRDELGIHSNADSGIEAGEFYDGGIVEGIENREDEVCDTAEELGEKTHEAYLKGIKKELSSALDDPSLTPQERRQIMLDMRDSGVGKLSSSEKADGLNWLDIWNSTANPKQDVPTSTNDLTSTDPSGSSSSKNKKTVAETIAEEYTKKLKANKYLQDALTKEITLWNLQNADAVSNEELLAKRSETVSKSIELQVERVRIAQEQYDQLLKRAPKDDKTKDAYNTLLDEQASLEKLKQSRYDDIWDDILSRYENDSKTAENEYELWAAIYEDSASVTEKTNRKLEYINEKIATQAKVLTAAEEEYTQLKDEFGEENQRTQTAYRKYLEEQKNQQDLINALEQAQLEQFDNQIARYEKAYKLIENRQQMLAKIYDDGSLSGQKDAYESAVNKYGKDSKEARAASRQGVMSSLVATGTALANATQSWKKLREYQEKYEKIENKNSDDALDAYAALQSEQYNFVSVAESLATALDLSDSGKKAMMQLGYTISKNWRPIQNGFAKVWAKLPQGMSDGITKGLDLVMSGGAAETMTSFAQTIVATMTGDYATAIVAGMNTVIEFMNSDFGKKVMDGLGTLFAKTADKLGATDVGSDLLSTLIAGLAGKGDLLAGLGDGVVKVVGVIGSALAKLASMLGSGGVIGLIVAAVAGCAGLLIANWDKVKEWFEGFGTWLKDTFTGIWEGIKNFGKGIIDGFKKIFGIHSPSTVMDEIGGNIMKGLENGIRDSAEGVNQTLQDAGNAALDVAQLGAEKLLSLLNNVDEAYEPTIRPVVDLTDAKESAAWMDTNLVDGQRRVQLDVSRSANLADNVAQRAEAQKAAGMKDSEKDHKNEMSNKDIVEAIGTLGGRIDSVAKAVSGMKVNINGKKLVGEILTDVDEGLGRRARG